MAMNNLIKPILVGCMPVAIASFLVTGCQESSAPAPKATIDATTTYIPSQVNQESTPPTIVVSPTSTPVVDESIKHEAQVAGITKVDQDDVPSQIFASPKPTAKPKIKAEDAYQQEKPTLMGLKLGTPKASVLERFGKVKKQFLMEEDDIEVYDFNDFSVGFNSKGTLEFVDVHSIDIDPGLHGLRLGQSQQDAIAILGKPDTNSTYVLSYKAQGTLLKIDIDPHDNTIQSIKLFANS
ncbi:DUF4309 domain-containing protein [Paenibacillus qinlingensis]|uniref:DUF4309 domain-containing protein n=1 Tax=Paenibacillus qinlingensis TaxID=1837343 RepID=UPI001565F1B4|nr:DUF4309 domain-containing protein [Paenibacillus qinlingensis]NQX59913.1 DUF4309 domain-containing protein [Paenibacillus qinlingensis]